MKKLILAGILLFTSGYLISAEINNLDVTDGNNTGRFPEGMAPSAVNDGARALEGLIARWYTNTAGSTDSAGAADVYTLDAQGTFTLFDGQSVAFTVTLDNTGSSTLNVDATGAKSILKHFNQPLEAGDLKSGQIVRVVYDGTNWQLVSPLAQKETPTLAAGSVTADVISNGSVTFANMVSSDQGGLITYNSSSEAVTIDAGSSGQVLTSNGSSSQPSFQTRGALVKIATAVSTDFLTGTTTVAWDDTIMLSASGDEYMSIDYTPSSVSNNIRITAHFNVTNSNASNFTVGLFAGSTADSLAQTAVRLPANDLPVVVYLSTIITPDSLNTVKYKLRAGNAAAGTTTMNGASGARKGGGKQESRIIIEEFVP